MFGCCRVEIEEVENFCGDLIVVVVYVDYVVVVF